MSPVTGIQIIDHPGEVGHGQVPIPVQCTPLYTFTIAPCSRTDRYQYLYTIIYFYKPLVLAQTGTNIPVHHYIILL